MQKLFDYRIRSDDLLRALSIILVVFHHVYAFRAGYNYEWLYGGMTLLMMLSGYNFSRFTLASGEPRQIVRSITRFIWQIVWPTLLLHVLLFAALRRVEWTELLLVSHWFHGEPVYYLFAIYWYVQVIVQILAVLAILYCLPHIKDLMSAHSYVTACLLLFVGMAARIVCPLIWDTRPLHDWLPHLYLWNFVLGWFVHASISKSEKMEAPIYKYAALAVTTVCAIIAWPIRPMAMVLLPIGCLFVCWLPALPFPRWLARPVLLISQSIFTIYLLHIFIPPLIKYTIRPWFGVDSRIFDGVLSIAVCTGLWMVGTAAIRAFRALSLPVQTTGQTSI